MPAKPSNAPTTGRLTKAVSVTTGDSVEVMKISISPKPLEIPPSMNPVSPHTFAAWSIGMDLIRVILLGPLNTLTLAEC